MNNDTTNSYAVIDTNTGITIKYGVRAKSAKEALNKYLSKEWIQKHKMNIEVMTTSEYLHSAYYLG